MSKEKVYQFTDPTKPAKSLIVMLKIEIIFAVISIIARLNASRVLLNIKNGNFSSEEEMVSAAERIDKIGMFIAGIDVLIGIIVLIIFIRWMYRAAANNFAWGIENISQKPHWCWINFIIPIWFLFKPYYFFREMWNAVEFDGADPEAWKNLPAPKCLKMYWICFIVRLIFNQIISRMEKGKDLSIDTLIAISNLCIVTTIVEIALDVALIMLVSGIMARQLQYWSKLNQHVLTEISQ